MGYVGQADADSARRRDSSRLRSSPRIFVRSSTQRLQGAARNGSSRTVLHNGDQPFGEEAEAHIQGMTVLPHRVKCRIGSQSVHGHEYPPGLFHNAGGGQGLVQTTDIVEQFLASRIAGGRLADILNATSPCRSQSVT